MASLSAASASGSPNLTACEYQPGVTEYAFALSFGNYLSELHDGSKTSRLLVAAVLVFVPGLLFGRSLVQALLSNVIHLVLCVQQPIRHVKTGATIPTTKYQWPNGQGDAAKFLKGRENSELWHERFGDIYRIWSGTTSEVVLTKPEHIQAVFKDSDKHAKAVNNNSGYLLSQLLGRCVGLISHDAYKRLRDVTQPPFTHKAAINYIPLIQTRVQRHLEQQSRSTSSRLHEGIIHPANDLRVLPFWIVAEIIYGDLSSELETELEAIVPIREGLMKYVISGGIARFSWSRYFRTAANTDLAHFKDRWRKFNDKARTMAGGKTGAPAPIVSMYEAVENGECTLEELLQTLDEMLFANLDVTLGGLTWNLVQLAAHEDVQSRLRKEIVAAKRDAQRHSHMPFGAAFASYLDRADSYIQAVISESSRLRPLAAFSVPQSAPTSRILDGYEIPAGTNFIIDSHSLNQRNAFWGSDGVTFRPQRFLECSAAEARYNFWRFGFGPRQCMGKYVADLIIRAILVELVDHYELSLIDEDSEWKRDEEVWIDHPVMELNCIRRTD